MTTVTGLSSIASLSLGLSMSMTGGAVDPRTAKLQSQLSLVAAPPPHQPVAPRHSSLDPTPPPPRPAPTHDDPTPPRPGITRQTAVCPPLSDDTPAPAAAPVDVDVDADAGDSDAQATDDDRQVTVVSF